jgi:hypothetical protein
LAVPRLPGFSVRALEKLVGSDRKLEAVNEGSWIKVVDAFFEPVEPWKVVEVNTDVAAKKVEVKVARNKSKAKIPGESGGQSCTMRREQEAPFCRTEVLGTKG